MKFKKDYILYIISVTITTFILIYAQGAQNVVGPIVGGNPSGQYHPISEIWIPSGSIINWGGVSFTNISNLTVSQHINVSGSLCIKGNCITSWGDISGKTIPQAIKDKDLNYLSMFLIDDLIKNGSVTVNDYAALINSVGTPDFWAVAFSFASDDIIASILNSSSISIDKAASILNSPSISSEKIVSIFNSANISPARIKSILSSNNISANKVQAILYKMVDLGYYDRVLQIMTVDAQNSTISSNTNLTSGVNLYRTLTINSGVTLTLGSGPGVIIADIVNNYGSIVSGWVKGVGGKGAANGDGGDGAGGIIILARNIIVGTIRADGKNGKNGGSGGATGWGYDGGDGVFWLIGSDLPGKGGNGGGRCGGKGGYNGGGGGGEDYSGYVPGDTIYDLLVCGGNGGSFTAFTAVIFDTETALLNELFKSVVDWWIINVLGKRPTVYKNIPYLGGAGGGGGGAFTESYNTPIEDDGGGGGGGGQIIIYGTSITAGTITVRGGNGGNGGALSSSKGGGGGGGGVVYVFYRSYTGTFSIDVSGGAGGSGKGGNGENGSRGTYRTIQLQ